MQGYVWYLKLFQFVQKGGKKKHIQKKNIYKSTQTCLDFKLIISFNLLFFCFLFVCLF